MKGFYPSFVVEERFPAVDGAESAFAELPVDHDALTRDFPFVQRQQGAGREQAEGSHPLFRLLDFPFVSSLKHEEKRDQKPGEDPETEHVRHNNRRLALNLQQVGKPFEHADRPQRLGIVSGRLSVGREPPYQVLGEIPYNQKRLLIELWTNEVKHLLLELVFIRQKSADQTRRAVDPLEHFDVRETGSSLRESDAAGHSVKVGGVQYVH